MQTASAAAVGCYPIPTNRLSPQVDPVKRMQGFSELCSPIDPHWAAANAILFPDDVGRESGAMSQPT